jgi:pseudouridine-5'-phosphate glycosidase
MVFSQLTSDFITESTIVTHGMPYPTNLSMAREVESILSAQGVTPATVAVFRGKVHVG